MTPLDQTLHQLIGRQDDIVWWQMCLRAAVILLFGLLLVRMAGKRVFGKWGAIDIILSVIIGSNLSRALTASAPFLETLAATATLVILHGLITAVAVRVKGFGPVVKGQPSRLMHDGRLDPAALRRHGVGRHDLEEALRSAGLTHQDQAHEIWIERNGEISVIKR